MTVNMDVKVDDADVQKMFTHAMQRLHTSNVDKALGEVAVALIENNAARWGKGWKPEADSTLAQKKGQGEPEVRTGAYKESLTVPGGAHQVHEIAHSTLRLGTDLYYAKWQQKGTRRGGKRKTKSVRQWSKSTGQPARPAMRWTPTVRKSVKETLKRKLLPGGRG